MKRLVFSVFAFMLFISGMANTSEKIEDYTYLLIWKSENAYSAYKCSENPVVIPMKEYILLKTKDAEIHFSANAALKFTFGKTEEVETSVTEAKSEGTFEVNQSEIIIKNLTGKKTCRIYTPDGKLVAQKTAKGNELRIDISGLPKNIYAVQCGETNFKFIKR